MAKVVARAKAFLPIRASNPYGIAIAQVCSTSIAGPYRIRISGWSLRRLYATCRYPYAVEGGRKLPFAIGGHGSAARGVGLDRFEVRSRNLISESGFIRREGRFAEAKGSGRAVHKALEMMADRLGAQNLARRGRGAGAMEIRGGARLHGKGRAWP